MPPVFTRYLAERLNSVSTVKVCEAAGGELLQSGHAYLAPGNFHMTVAASAKGWTTCLNQGPLENSCRPAVDVLFRSVAELVGPHALAAVLTGMGQDGLRGSGVIRQQGGYVLAQDQATSVVWGMPGSVANAGLADQILPLDHFADEFSRLTQVQTIPKLNSVRILSS